MKARSERERFRPGPAVPTPHSTTIDHPKLTIAEEP